MSRLPRSVLPFLLAAATAQEGDGITWLTGLAEAKRAAAAKQSPLFVVFRCER